MTSPEPTTTRRRHRRGPPNRPALRGRRMPPTAHCSMRSRPRRRRSTAMGSCRRIRSPTRIIWCRHPWQRTANGARKPWRCCKPDRWTPPARGRISVADRGRQPHGCGESRSADGGGRRRRVASRRRAGERRKGARVRGQRADGLRGQGSPVEPRSGHDPDHGRLPRRLRIARVRRRGPQGPGGGHARRSALVGSAVAMSAAALSTEISRVSPVKRLRNSTTPSAQPRPTTTIHGTPEQLRILELDPG